MGPCWSEGPWAGRGAIAGSGTASGSSCSSTASSHNAFLSRFGPLFPSSPRSNRSAERWLYPGGARCLMYNGCVQTITKPATEHIATLTPLPIHRRRRFLRISWCFARIILHIFLFDVLFNRFWLTRWYARRSGIARWQKMARRFRHVAVRTGGVMIKLGQFLSARADILPAAITDELAGLQDEVPAAPLPYVLATLIQEL